MSRRPLKDGVAKQNQMSKGAVAEILPFGVVSATLFHYILLPGTIRVEKELRRPQENSVNVPKEWCKWMFLASFTTGYFLITQHYRLNRGPH